MMVMMIIMMVMRMEEDKIARMALTRTPHYKCIQHYLFIEC